MSLRFCFFNHSHGLAPLLVLVVLLPAPLLADGDALDVGCEIEALGDGGTHGGSLADVALTLQEAEVLTINDDELAVHAGHDVVAVAVLGMGSIGYLDSLTITQVVSEIVIRTGDVVSHGTEPFHNSFHRRNI